MNPLAFGTPWLAWGALAAVVPVVIHLLNRRRAQLTYFPAVEFVRASTRRVARREWLKQLLLLLARTVALAALGLALARPYLAAPAAAPVAVGPPAIEVHLLDDSASMAWEDGGETMYARAVAAARERLARLRPVDAAVVLRSSSVPEPLPRPADRLASLAALPDDPEPSLAAAPLGPALEAAARILAADERTVRRLVLYTDRAAHALSLDTSPWPPGSAPPEVEIVDLGGPPNPGNRAVVAVTAELAPDEGPRAVRVQATVAAFGPAVEGLPVVLEVEGDELARGFVDVPAAGRARKDFLVRLEQTGTVAARVRVDGDDGLPVDDGRPLALQVQRRLRLLLVDGAPSPIPHRDEIFYLERALDPTRGARGNVELSVVEPEALAEYRLDEYDAVFLCNVPAEALGSAAARLAAYVRGGGGLLVSVGDQVDPAETNRVLGELLPGRLGQPGAAATESRPGVRLGTVRHPLLGALRGDGGRALAAVRVGRWIDLEPGSERAVGQVLLELTSGLPLLLEARSGEGRVLLLLTSVDRDWADLAISPAFLPLIQRAGEHLAHTPLDEAARETRVGELRSIPVPSGTRSLAVRGPVGPDVEFSADELRGVTEVAFARTRRPGVFRVQRDGRDGGGFAVVLDAREADLARLPLDALEQALGGAPGQATRITAPLAGVDRPLWAPLLLLAAALLLAEAVLRGWP